MLTPLQSGITGRGGFGKGGSEIESGNIGIGTLPIGAPGGLGEKQILAKSVFSSCILSS